MVLLNLCLSNMQKIALNCFEFALFETVMFAHIFLYVDICNQPPPPRAKLIKISFASDVHFFLSKLYKVFSWLAFHRWCKFIFQFVVCLLILFIHAFGVFNAGLSGWSNESMGELHGFPFGVRFDKGLPH